MVYPNDKVDKVQHKDYNRCYYDRYCARNEILRYDSSSLLSHCLMLSDLDLTPVLCHNANVRFRYPVQKQRSKGEATIKTWRSRAQNWRWHAHNAVAQTVQTESQRRQASVSRQRIRQFRVQRSQLKRARQPNKRQSCSWTCQQVKVHSMPYRHLICSSSNRNNRRKNNEKENNKENQYWIKLKNNNYINSSYQTRSESGMDSFSPSPNSI